MYSTFSFLGTLSEDREGLILISDECKSGITPLIAMELHWCKTGINDVSLTVTDATTYKSKELIWEKAQFKIKRPDSPLSFYRDVTVVNK